MDNTINRAVRHAYRILGEKGLSGILADLSAFDTRLESLGVKDNVPNPKDLDDIRYTRMNAVYKPVVNLCKTIISNDASSFEGNERKVFSYMRYCRIMGTLPSTTAAAQSLSRLLRVFT